MAESIRDDTLGPEIKVIPCRTRCASGCDMGHSRLGYLIAPMLASLAFPIFVYALHHEGDVLNKLGLLHFTSVVTVCMFVYFAAVILQYWFWFSAPDCPITVHENGIGYKQHKLLFSDLRGLRVGSSEVEDPMLQLGISPFGRLSRAMACAEQARQNAVNCSIHLVTSNWREVTINKGLVMYERDDLERLIQLINEMQPESAGLDSSGATPAAVAAV